MDDSCLFCKIIQGKIPSSKVMENDLVFAFLDINPLSPKHTLIIPKTHAAKVHELPEEYAAALGAAVSRVAKAIGAEHYNVLQNNGERAHQAVHHVHYHIIPKLEDGSGLGIKWPSTSPKPEELAAATEEIRNKL